MHGQGPPLTFPIFRREALKVAVNDGPKRLQFLSHHGLCITKKYFTVCIYRGTKSKRLNIILNVHKLVLVILKFYHNLLFLWQ